MCFSSITCREANSLKRYVLPSNRAGARSRTSLSPVRGTARRRSYFIRLRRYSSPSATLRHRRSAGLGSSHENSYFSTTSGTTNRSFPGKISSYFLKEIWCSSRHRNARTRRISSSIVIRRFSRHRWSRLPFLVAIMRQSKTE